MADNFKNGGTPDRSRVSMDDQHQVRYWMETIGCSKDELAAAVARVGNSPDAVRREVYRHWAYGTVRRTLLRRKCLSGQEDGQAGEGVKAPVRSPEPPHQKGSESPPGNAGDGNLNPLAVGAVGSRPPEAGHRHLALPQSSSASRFNAGASGFFILSQSDERPER